MTTYSTIAGLPLPENTDGLVAERAFGDYASALDSLIVPQYSTAAARDAAMTSGKVEGMVCAVNGELQMWDGSTWWTTQNSRYVTKGSDETRTSTIVQAVDAQLQFATQAEGYYFISANLSAGSASTVPGFACTWTSAIGTAQFIHRDIIAVPVGAASRDNTTLLTPVSINSTITASATPPTASGSWHIENLIVYTPTADTIRLNWGQSVSNASGTVLQARSYIEYRRIA